MFNTYFSLTEELVMKPVLRLRGELDAEPSIKSCCNGRLWSFAKSEVVARVFALAASFFSAIDAVIHFYCFAGKGLCYALNKMNIRALPSYSSCEIWKHGIRITDFIGLTLISPFIAIINPSFFKRMIIPSGNLHGKPNTSHDEKSWRKLASARLYNFVDNVYEAIDNEKSLLPFKQEWKILDLAEKDLFVQWMNSKGDFGVEIREKMAGIVYRPITFEPRKRGQKLNFSQKKVCWVTENEISRRLKNKLNHGFFYHATSLKGIEGILRSKKIEVRHEKAFKGAFVSTRPENFGKYTLIFKRSIDRLSKLEHGFPMDRSFWAGFSQDIPVTPSTIVGVLCDDSNDIKKIGEKIHEWFGQPLTVSCLKDTQTVRKKISAFETGIPSEWGQDSEKVALMIYQTLRKRALVKLKIPKQQMLAMSH